MSVEMRMEWAGFPEMEARASMAVEKLARDLGAKWQANIVDVGSVDTGAYLNSVVAEQTGPTEWTVHDGVIYGVFNEFGTVHMAARPAAQPAFEEIKSTAGTVFAEIFA